MNKIVSLALALLFGATAMAQYPVVTDAGQAEHRKMMAREHQLSDEAWQKALPIIKKEALEGRPFVPWAHRPYDLMQATIPAFPGAEGGGMYTPGGRGGKVITVTNLNDRGP
ncbi:MAG: polysaccharide lyase, partial [Alistipes sp.]|nr:polysaccharide lyase [Alistipes sp.]